MISCAAAARPLAAGYWLPGGREESAGPAFRRDKARRGFWRGKQAAGKEGSTAPGRLWREEDDGKRQAAWVKAL